MLGISVRAGTKTARRRVRPLEVRTRREELYTRAIKLCSEKYYDWEYIKVVVTYNRTCDGWVRTSGACAE